MNADDFPPPSVVPFPHGDGPWRCDGCNETFGDPDECFEQVQPDGHYQFICPFCDGETFAVPPGRWWVISEHALLTALLQVQMGTQAGIVMVELLANCEPRDAS